MGESHYHLSFAHWFLPITMTLMQDSHPVVSGTAEQEEDHPVGIPTHIVLCSAPSQKFL